MGESFLHGNGGSNLLNFKVVSGASAPANPKENTIWVKTSIALADWHFSNTRPENPVPGTVWICISNSSSARFNALKKNELMVYPIRAERYTETVLDSGEIYAGWDVKEAKIYQNGEWKAWTLTVVPNPDSYGSTKWEKYCTENSGNPSVSVSSTTLSVTLNAYKNDGVSAAYIPVDVTEYSKMTIAGSYTVPNSAYGANLGISVGMFASPSGSMATGYYHSGAKDDTTTSIDEKSYDISGLTGICYFLVRAVNYASTSDYVKNPTVELTKVLFE